MRQRRALAAIVAVATGFIPAAHGATQQDEIAELRAQLKALRDDYESRLGALEQRLKEAEARTAAPAPAALGTGPGPVPGIAAFNPAVSVVLQGTYANVRGDASPVKRGFSLAESELNLSANVDDKFAGVLIASLSPEDTISVEEAYGLYTAAGGGLAPKFGRFYSGIGYLNEQHQHAWDFVDAPLAYQAFLGGQHRMDGIQAKWVAPTDLFLELSGEAGNGSMADRNKNGIGTGAAAVHAGGDVGESHTWRAGLSYLHTRVESEAYAGRSNLGIADFVWKWAPGGNAREVNAKLQGEYFRRSEASTTSGWYLQGVYQFMPQWRVGARYDRVDPGASFEPKRWSAMLDWSPSEFSRFRLQFQRAQLEPGRTDDQLFVQYILTLGAHGAHRY